MISDKSIRSNINYYRVIGFCLILIQSIGIRFFEGQGIFLSLLIIILSYKSFRKLLIKDYKFLFTSILFLVICKFFNPSFLISDLIFQTSLIICAYLFVIQYRKQPHLIQYEFFISLSFFAYHALASYLIFLLIPGKFVQFKTMHYSLFNLFYVSDMQFMSFQRNSGLFWEPGVLQLAMNLYLFYCIKYKKNIISIIIAGLIVFSTFSTIGFFILVLNFIYFFYLKFTERRISILNIALVVGSLILFTPILIYNSQNKMSGGNTSGLVRLRDLLIGIELIKEKPIIGHGKFDIDYLLTKSYVVNTENDLFSKSYIQSSGEMGGGYTNGLLGLIAWYGIPVSFLLYYFYFKNRFIDNNFIERSIYCLIPLFSMISEPIAYTSFFLMFPLSYWILKNYKSNIIEHRI